MKAAGVTRTVTMRPGAAFCLRLTGFLGRRLWLPHAVYVAIPWLYLGVGVACLMGSLFLPDSVWTYPYLALFGMICLHAGVTIASLRRKRNGRGHAQTRA